MLTLQSCELHLPDRNRAALEEGLKQIANMDWQRSHGHYPPPEGEPALREDIRRITPEWSGPVLVTNSATEALHISLLHAGFGKTLALNVPAYFGVIRQAKQFGMQIAPWHTIDELEALGKCDVILATTNFISPSGHCFSDEEKARIADTARKNGALLIEDNAYDPLWFDKPKSMVPYENSIQVGSLSKLAGPAFRLGFIRAEDGLYQKLRSEKITVNLSTPTLPQLAVAFALTDNLHQHLREEIRTRTETLQAAIRERFSVEPAIPEGGPYLRFDLPKGIEMQPLLALAKDRGLLLDDNRFYYPDGHSRPYIRLHSGAIATADIAQATDILADCVRDLSPHQTSKSALDIKGKRILVIGGKPKEVIDGVRHYANEGRPEDHGHRVANELLARGAEVTLVTAKTHYTAPEGVQLITQTPTGGKIINASDLAETIGATLGAAQYDMVLNLANISGIRPAQASDHKLKVKKGAGEKVPLEVTGNIDLMEILPTLPNAPTIIMGYTNQQEYRAINEVSAISDIIRQQNRKIQETAGSTIVGSKLAGKTIIITSGPTAETLTSSGDVISNFSSGKQGHAIAEVLAKMGARVMLISGPTTLPDPANPNVTTIHVSSAVEMRDKALEFLPVDAFIGVAAVADFGMASPAPLGLGIGEQHTLMLAQNPDILQTMGTHPHQRPTVVIGFAAETHDLVQYARGKLEKKGADAICANDVGIAMQKRDSSRNQIKLVTPDGVEEHPEMTKAEIGELIGNHIARLLEKRKLAKKRDPLLPDGSGSQVR